MTDKERAVFAIGYLRGISAILWNLDRADAPVQLSCEEAAYFDAQIDVLAHAVLTDEEVDG